jgi:hypothetical protein
MSDCKLQWHKRCPYCHGEWGPALGMGYSRYMCTQCSMVGQLLTPSKDEGYYRDVGKYSVAWYKRGNCLITGVAPELYIPLEYHLPLDVTEDLIKMLLVFQ